MSPGEPLENVEEAIEIRSSGDVQNLLFLLSVANLPEVVSGVLMADG